MTSEQLRSVVGIETQLAVSDNEVAIHLLAIV